ncbi:MAG TPA: M48 family metallopeptidase, partial [Aggregatilineales bacterium]|nr:M48 family metallopeptidase [Aggregatilineales bacterium]
MKDFKIQAGDETLTLTVDVDARLRTTARWVLRGSTIVLRVPPTMNRDDVNRIVGQITPRIVKQRKRAARQTDINLSARAEAINRQYFDGELTWHSIRWVRNMQRRLGSCTTGGTTDGDIRISDRIRRWPDYVIDYVIAHEICHRKFPNHSPEFWDYLGRYPQAAKALGFVEGISYAE